MTIDKPTEDFPQGRPLTQNELKLDALRFDVRAWNAGARLADDCFCPSCGARGYFATCPRCQRCSREDSL